MQRWIAWFVIAVCGVAYAQNTDVDANQRILRALRTFNTAQVLYRVYGKGFACRLEQLGPPQDGAKPSPQAAGLIDEELASGEFAGYHIRLNCTPDDYQVIAVPAFPSTGALWCVDKSMVLRTADTVDKCIVEGKVPPRPKRATPDQFSETAPGVTQETRARGCWVDPSNGLMWAARDSGKRGSWHKAMKMGRRPHHECALCPRSQRSPREMITSPAPKLAGTYFFPKLLVSGHTESYRELMSFCPTADSHLH